MLNIKIRYFTFFLFFKFIYFSLFSFFLLLSHQNQVCILHFQHFSIWTSHISSAQQLHVASGCCIGQHRLERSILKENSSGQCRYRAGGPGFESLLDRGITLGKVLLRGSVSTEVRIIIAIPGVYVGLV